MFSITLGTAQDPNKSEVISFIIISLLCLLFHMGYNKDQVKSKRYITITWQLIIYPENPQSTEKSNPTTQT